VSGNGGDGFQVGYGSGFIISGSRMPKHGGENATPAEQLNGRYGLQCLVGSYIVGSVAKLVGKRGSKSVDASCLEHTETRYMKAS